MNAQEIINELAKNQDKRLGDYAIIPISLFHGERDVEEVIECQGVVCGNKVTLHVGLDSQFPCSLPIIILENKDVFGILPHVENDGYICYLSPEGLLLNYNKPDVIVYECLLKAIMVLEDGITGRNADDFYNEFEAFIMDPRNKTAKFKK